MNHTPYALAAASIDSCDQPEVGTAFCSSRNMLPAVDHSCHPMRRRLAPVGGRTTSNPIKRAQSPVSNTAIARDGAYGGRVHPKFLGVAQKRVPTLRSPSNSALKICTGPTSSIAGHAAAEPHPKIWDAPMAGRIWISAIKAPAGLVRLRTKKKLPRLAARQSFF